MKLFYYLKWLFKKKVVWRGEKCYFYLDGINGGGNIYRCYTDKWGRNKGVERV